MQGGLTSRAGTARPGGNCHLKKGPHHGKASSAAPPRCVCVGHAIAGAGLHSGQTTTEIAAGQTPGVAACRMPGCPQNWKNWRVCVRACLQLSWLRFGRRAGPREASFALIGKGRSEFVPAAQRLSGEGNTKSPGTANLAAFLRLPDAACFRGTARTSIIRRSGSHELRICCVKTHIRAMGRGLKAPVCRMQRAIRSAQRESS